MQMHNKNYLCFDFRTCLKCAHWAKKSDKTCMGEKSESKKQTLGKLKNWVRQESMLFLPTQLCWEKKILIKYFFTYFTTGYMFNATYRRHINSN